MQSALSAAQAAQDNLNRLSEKPTPPNLPPPRPTSFRHETALDKLKKGPKESELRKAELNVRQAMIELEQARLDREHADVVAPIDGTVLSVAELGQQASRRDGGCDPGGYGQRSPGGQRRTRTSAASIPGQFVDISVFALPDEPVRRHVDSVA